MCYPLQQGGDADRFFKMTKGKIRDAFPLDEKVLLSNGGEVIIGKLNYASIMEIEDKHGSIDEYFKRFQGVDNVKIRDMLELVWSLTKNKKDYNNDMIKMAESIYPEDTENIRDALFSIVAKSSPPEVENGKKQVAKTATKRRRGASKK